MKHFSTIMLAMCLSVLVLASCKKGQINAADSNGSGKGIGKTSAILRTIYVSSGSAGNDQTANPFSPSSPLKTLQAAHDMSRPGDQIIIMAGTYEPISTVSADQYTPILKITRSGTAADWIIYKAASGTRPVIYSKGYKWEAIVIDASYIRIEGLELKGDSPNLSRDEALATEVSYRPGGAAANGKAALFSTNGITVGRDAAAHHVEILNNIVHHFPAGGINSGKADYVIINGNTCHDNAWYAMYSCSGISTWMPDEDLYNFDNGSGYKIKITRNKCYNNITKVPFVSLNNGKYSDGNGIIIDHRPAAATGRVLIENNLCYANGGSGICLTRAVRVDVLNNTVYGNVNNIDFLPAADWADFKSVNSTYVRVQYNIFHTTRTGLSGAQGQAIQVWNPSTNPAIGMEFAYNLAHNGTVTSGYLGTGSSTANPSFGNGPGSNFWLNLNSPAINLGLSTTLSGSRGDYFMTTRPKNGRFDAGAYEVN